jgi:GAF domain-containing protein
LHSGPLPLLLPGRNAIARSSFGERGTPWPPVRIRIEQLQYDLGEGPFPTGPADLEVAQAFADVATIAILQHRAALEAQVLNQQLIHALNSRVILEQSKGMVAERLNLDMERSFAALRHHARHHNLRLSDVAQSVIDGSLAPSALDASPAAAT